MLKSDVSFTESSNQLRRLIGTGLLSFTDLRDDPAKFFHAHRVLARHAVEHGVSVLVQLLHRASVCFDVPFLLLDSRGWA